MQIEPGVPMRGYTTRPPKYRFPLAEMEVGDSFFVAYGTMDAKSFLQTSRSLISRFGCTCHKSFLRASNVYARGLARVGSFPERKNLRVFANLFPTSRNHSLDLRQKRRKGDIFFFRKFSHG